MTCFDYNNLTIPEKNDDMLFSEYWYEFLPEVLFTYTVAMDIDISNDVLLRNYDFYKLCHSFNGGLDALISLLKGNGYGNIIKMEADGFKADLKE